jgi:hypothetical protein
MSIWLVGIGCLAVGLYGTNTARDKGLAQRWSLVALSWAPLAIWAASTLIRAWRHS